MIWQRVDVISAKFFYLIFLLLVTVCTVACSKGRHMEKIDYSKYYSDANEKKLVQAVMIGDIMTIKRLAAQGVNLNAVGTYENTPLRVAIKVGQKAAIECLLNLGVSPNLRTPKGVAAANAAIVFQRDPVFLKILFEHGLDANLKSEDEPLIFFAVAEGRWKHYDMLLAKGADINSKTGDGSSLLLDLVMQLEYDRAKDLLVRGADCTVVSMTGLNVLDQLIDYQRRFCVEPGLPACYKRAELLQLMQERGIAVPPGLPYM